MERFPGAGKLRRRRLPWSLQIRREQAHGCKTPGSTVDRRPEERGLVAWSSPLIAILAILARIVKHPGTCITRICLCRMSEISNGQIKGLRVLRSGRQANARARLSGLLSEDL